MIINHNLPAMNTFRQLSTNNSNTSKSLEKLSSGLRINRAGDDAAGLAISEKMRSQIRGLDQASSNAQDGISLIQTAEGALQEVHSMLQRMKELAVQAANDTNTTYDRSQIQDEINQLTSEINRIGNTTEFNTMKLLDGSKSAIINGPAPTESTKYLSTGTAFDVATSAGVTVTNGGISLTDNKLSIKDGAFANLNLTTANNNTLDLLWDKAAQTLQVTLKGIVGEAPTQAQIDASLGAGNPVNVSVTLTADANGNITFSEGGVSFMISKEELARLQDKAGIKVELRDALGAVGNPNIAKFDAIGTISTGNSWDYNGVGAKASGVSIDAGYEYTTVAITGTGLQAAGGVIVVSGVNANGNVFTDTVTLVAANTVTAGDIFHYSNNGINFDLYFPRDAAAGGTPPGNSFSLTLSSDPAGTNFFATRKTTILTETAGTTTYDNSKTLTFQIGANAGQGMVAGITDMRSLALGVSSAKSGASVDLTQFDPTLVKNTGITVNGQYISEARTAQYVISRNVNSGSDNVDVEYALDVSSYDNATAAITIYDQAINKVSSERSKLGAMQNRLEHTITNLDSTSENLQAAESRIRDVNMAKEMMAFQKNSILAQAATAMLAQANQMPQNVLQLLR